MYFELKFLFCFAQHFNILVTKQREHFPLQQTEYWSVLTVIPGIRFFYVTYSNLTYSYYIKPETNEQ